MAGLVYSLSILTLSISVNFIELQYFSVSLFPELKIEPLVAMGGAEMSKNSPYPKGCAVTGGDKPPFALRFK